MQLGKRAMFGMGVVAMLVAPAAADAATTSYTTPGTYTFKVPGNVIAISVAATGAGGGADSYGCTPGMGGLEQATVAVHPGESITVLVGGQGGNATLTTGGSGGTGGGGAGGTTGEADSPAGGGGGASGVSSSGDTPLVVAGGGGGCGGFAEGAYGNGGNDASAGADGAYGGTNNALGGGAGTQTSGGAGGASSPNSDPPGANGSAGLGGAGANSADENGGGGGGGGGYYGGGGGGGVQSGDGVAGGGGGGSDYAPPGATGVSTTHGVNAGSGQVTISYTAQPKPTATTGAAGPVKASRASVHGTAQPQKLSATYRFEYGTTRSYGHLTSLKRIASGRSSAAVKAVITGLKPHTKYHYRLIVKTASGVSYGRDRTFTTAAAPTPPFTG